MSLFVGFVSESDAVHVVVCGVDLLSHRYRHDGFAGVRILVNSEALGLGFKLLHVYTVIVNVLSEANALRIPKTLPPVTGNKEILSSSW